MFNFWTTLYIFVAALILAGLEVEIEGGFGWAGKLPTWRPDKKLWYSKLFSRLFNNKQLTGYHLHVFALVMMFFHLPFFFGLPWNWPTEFSVLSFYCIYAVIWDYLWFILNPHINIRNFKKEAAYIHKNWWGPFPVDYYYGFIFSFIFYLATINSFTWSKILPWITTVLLMVVLIIITNIAEPAFRREKRAI